jgi:hypothetical protein
MSQYLTDIERAVGYEAKALGARMLYDYMFDNCIDLLNSTPKLKNTVINKAYELKKAAPNQVALICSLNKVLTMLGAPLTEPTAPTEYNPSMALFIALAKKYNAKNTLKNPERSYLLYTTYFLRRFADKNWTVLESMQKYFFSESIDAQRATLMKTLFLKNNLVYNDVVMALYYDWLPSYTPTTLKTNRYIKMTQFIHIHKSLFQ